MMFKRIARTSRVTLSVALALSFVLALFTAQLVTGSAATATTAGVQGPIFAALGGGAGIQRLNPNGSGKTIVVPSSMALPPSRKTFMPCSKPTWALVLPTSSIFSLAIKVDFVSQRFRGAQRLGMTQYVCNYARVITENVPNSYRLILPHSTSSRS